MSLLSYKLRSLHHDVMTTDYELVFVSRWQDHRLYDIDGTAGRQIINKLICSGDKLIIDQMFTREEFNRGRLAVRSLLIANKMVTSLKQYSSEDCTYVATFQFSLFLFFCKTKNIKQPTSLWEQYSIFHY